MNNDLISREALKATIIEHLDVNDAGKNDWFEGYYTAKNEDVYYIDNAPTVTPSLNLDNITEEDIEKFKIIWQRATSKGLFSGITVNCKDCDGYEAGYSAGLRDAEKEGSENENHD